MIFTIGPDNEKQELVVQYISRLHPNKKFDVEILPYKKKRTKKQNSYLHILFRTISEYTGDSEEVVKYKILDKLNLWVEFTNKDGEVKETLPKTSLMDTKQLNEIIEYTQVVCSTLGLNYLTPMELGIFSD